MHLGSLLSMASLQAAKKKGIEFILPTDVIIADKFAADAESKVVPVENIPDGWMVRPTQGCRLTEFGHTLLRAQATSAGQLSSAGVDVVRLQAYKQLAGRNSRLAGHAKLSSV